MEMETSIHKIMWLMVDGLAAVAVIGALQKLFFQGGFAEVVQTLGKGLGI